MSDQTVTVNERYCRLFSTLSQQQQVDLDHVLGYTRAEVKYLEGNLAEIRRLLTEAYEHYFATSDGHHKSGEGQISIHHPPFFWREDGAYVEPEVEIYSYVLSPSRTHYFKNSAEALEAVRRWHANEMTFDYGRSEWED